MTEVIFIPPKTSRVKCKAILIRTIFITFPACARLKLMACSCTTACIRKQRQKLF